MGTYHHALFLRVIAVVLLCSLLLTGCSGMESGMDAPGEVISSEDYQATEDTGTENVPTEHEHSFAEATCVAPRSCTTCSVTEGEPLGHSWQDATCTDPAVCSTCGESNGDARGHNWTPATCSAPATCDLCGITDGKAREHDWKKATCTTPATCEYCGQTDGTTIDHDWKAASCTAAATCIVCGKTKGSATEHNWKSATCTTPKTCKDCGTTKGSKASHNYSKGKCSACGEADPSYDESASTMVWIPTNGGKKYHSHSGCSNMKNPEKVTLAKAKKLGFTACKRCY